MANDPRFPGLRLLWVPIVVALIAAALVTVRGCQAGPEPSARATSRP
jgi:hypothetical protein